MPFLEPRQAIHPFCSFQYHKTNQKGKPQNNKNPTNRFSPAALSPNQAAKAADMQLRLSKQYQYKQHVHNNNTIMPRSHRKHTRQGEQYLVGLVRRTGRIPAHPSASRLEL